MKPRLHLVLPTKRPLTHLTRAEKLAHAKAYLQRRGLYVLDRGTPKPKWGIPGEPPRVTVSGTYRGLPTLIEQFSEQIRTLWGGG